MLNLRGICGKLFMEFVCLFVRGFEDVELVCVSDLDGDMV